MSEPTIIKRFPGQAVDQHLRETGRLPGASDVRTHDMQMLEARIAQLEDFIGDLHEVGRLRLSPEWMERFHKVTRHKYDPRAVAADSRS